MLAVLPHSKKNYDEARPMKRGVLFIFSKTLKRTVLIVLFYRFKRRQPAENMSFATANNRLSLRNDSRKLAWRNGSLPFLCAKESIKQRYWQKLRGIVENSIFSRTGIDTLSTS